MREEEPVHTRILGYPRCARGRAVECLAGPLTVLFAERRFVDQHVSPVRTLDSGAFRPGVAGIDDGPPWALLTYELCGAYQASVDFYVLPSVEAAEERPAQSDLEGKLGELQAQIQAGELPQELTQALGETENKIRNLQFDESGGEVILSDVHPGRSRHPRQVRTIVDDDA